MDRADDWDTGKPLTLSGEVRVYKVWGKADLMDSAWTYPMNSEHRFFKTEVEVS